MSNSFEDEREKRKRKKEKSRRMSRRMLINEKPLPAIQSWHGSIVHLKSKEALVHQIR